MMEERNEEIKLSCSGHLERASPSSEKKQKALNSLNFIEVQVRDVKRLIENDTYCDDVITLISTIQSALNSFSKVLLETHLKSCVTKKIQEGELEAVDDLLVTVQRLMKK